MILAKNGGTHNIRKAVKMNDKKQIRLLKDAIDAYENGEILEAKDMAIEFINNITDFEIESNEVSAEEYTQYDMWMGDRVESEEV